MSGNEGPWEARRGCFKGVMGGTTEAAIGPFNESGRAGARKLDVRKRTRRRMTATTRNGSWRHLGLIRRASFGWEVGNDNEGTAWRRDTHDLVLGGVALEIQTRLHRHKIVPLTAKENAQGPRSWFERDTRNRVGHGLGQTLLWRGWKHGEDDNACCAAPIR